MRIRLFAPILISSIVLCWAPAFAQTTELAMDLDNSRLWIDGTSNKSDWTVTATEMAGSLVLDASGSPSQAVVTVSAEKIESNKSKIMDRLMYRALKTQSHPTITYTLTTASAAGDSLETVGQFDVAGVTKEAPMTVEWVTDDSGSVRVRGLHPMKMTEYGMKPPTAMFGALHTGDDVVVHFDVVFAPTGI